MDGSVQTAARAGGEVAWPFAVERITGTLGAEVSGLDLTKPLGADVVDALSEALVAHKVLFFRDQDITLDQHLAFARNFGDLEVHPFTEGATDFNNRDTHPEIVRLESTAEKPNSADTWHSDVTWRHNPSLGSILRSLVSPAVGGDTLWADMATAYESLDDATKSRLSGMTAIHDWHGFRKLMRARGMDEAKIVALQEKFPPVEHPLIRTHPVSGAKIVYVNAAFTVSIKGMAESEGAPLLQRLYALSSRPEFQVRFRWRANSIAFWDNRSTQHYAAPDFYPQHRVMERATVVGDRPF